jgi:hypothetical protein
MSARMLALATAIRSRCSAVSATGDAVVCLGGVSVTVLPNRRGLCSGLATAEPSLVCGPGRTPSSRTRLSRNPAGLLI